MQCSGALFKLNNFFFFLQVGLNQSCEEYLTNEQQPFMRNHLINMFIVIFVGIIFVLVLMLCCSLSCMNCKRMKLNQRFKSNILYAEQIKKRQGKSIWNKQFQASLLTRI